MEEEAKPNPTSGFITGIPRSAYWIRLKTSEWINDKDLTELTGKLNLSLRPQEDNYFLVHGRKEDIALFLKEVRQRVKPEYKTL